MHLAELRMWVTRLYVAGEAGGMEEDSSWVSHIYIERLIYLCCIYVSQLISFELTCQGCKLRYEKLVNASNLLADGTGIYIKIILVGNTANKSCTWISNW